MDYGASQEKGRVMDQVRSQIAVANLQEMIIVSPLPHRTQALHLSVAACGTCMPVPLLPSQKMSDKCFRKCVSSPSSALDGREQVSLPRPLLCMRVWLVSVSQLALPLPRRNVWGTAWTGTWSRGTLSLEPTLINYAKIADSTSHAHYHVVCAVRHNDIQVVGALSCTPFSSLCIYVHRQVLFSISYKRLFHYIS